MVVPVQEEERSNQGLIIVGVVEKETHICSIEEESPPYSSVASDRSIIQDGPAYRRGQLVIVGKYNGRDLSVRQADGRTKKFIIIRETDILGILKQRSEREVPDVIPPESPGATTQ